MTKKKKKNLNNGCAALAKKNAKIVAEALEQVGFSTSIEVFTPYWCDNAPYKGEITQVTLHGLYSSDGDCYSLIFKNSDGKPLFW